ncbi:DUF6893 family small protein [Sciscionella marina]
MRKIGKLTTMMLLIGLGAAVVLGIRSVPDVKRYQRIRDM